MRSLLPKALIARIGVIVVGVILLIQLLALGVFLWSEAHDSGRLLAFSIRHRMAAALLLVESSSPQDRGLIVFAVNSPTLGMAVFEDAPFEEGERGRSIRRFTRALTSPGSPFRGREVRLRTVDQERHVQIAPRRIPRDIPDLERTGSPTAPPDLLPSQRKIEIATMLRDGTWVLFRLPAEEPSIWWAARMVLWIGATFLILSLLAFLALRRLARPLRELASHAERLGTDLETPPFPETGPSEVLAAARAFNLMQQRLKRHLNDRTIMLAALSHDLRTMLTRLRLRAEFIEDDEQRQKAARDLDDMHIMLETSLDFARGEALREAMISTDLAALVRTALDDLGDQGHEVSYHGPDHLVLRCRPVALRRALDNLLQNALAYGDVAEVTMIERAASIAIEIGDRGPGIPAEERERVFDPFYRLEVSRSRDTGGAGLGLAVARSIVRGHGGEIVLEDRAGGGLLVRLTLPAAP